MHPRNFLPHILVALLFLGGALVATAEDITPTSYSYEFLAPLPFVGDEAGADLAESSLATYLSNMLKLIVALGGVLSVFVGIVGGIQYVASGITPSAKNDAKNRIQNALTGLVLVLSSYLILNSINPNLVNISFELKNVAMTSASVLTTTTTTGAYATGYTTCTSDAHCNTGAGYKCDPIVMDASGYSVGSNTCILSETATSGWVSGAAWPDDADVRSDLATSYISVNRSDTCTIIGQGNTTEKGGIDGMSSCTSLYGLSSSVISSLKSLKTACAAYCATNTTNCPGDTSCLITITGGTEYWRHGNNETTYSKVSFTSHVPGGNAVDLRLDTATFTGLYKYITAKGTPTTEEGCATGTKYKIGTAVYVDETAGDRHWHVCY